MNESDRVKYESHVARGEERVCWQWMGRVHKFGHGIVWVFNRDVAAHRIAWTIAHGAPPPARSQMRHTCGNKLCQNPRHLTLGLPVGFGAMSAEKRLAAQRLGGQVTAASRA